MYQSVPAAKPRSPSFRVQTGSKPAMRRPSDKSRAPRMLLAAFFICSAIMLSHLPELPTSGHHDRLSAVVAAGKHVAALPRQWYAGLPPSRPADTHARLPAAGQHAQSADTEDRDGDPARPVEVQQQSRKPAPPAPAPVQPSVVGRTPVKAVDGGDDGWAEKSGKQREAGFDFDAPAKRTSGPASPRISDRKNTDKMTVQSGTDSRLVQTSEDKSPNEKVGNVGEAAKKTGKQWESPTRTEDRQDSAYKKAVPKAVAEGKEVGMQAREKEIATKAIPTDATANRPRKRYLYIMDYWERLNNIHAAMRNLIRLAKVADFTLVEPFMFESMVMRRLSTPQQFAATSLQVQRASKYMNMQHLFETGHFSTYETFAGEIARRRSDDTVLVGAALHVFWDDSAIDLPKDRKNAVFECDDVFRKLGYGRKNNAWVLSPGFHASRSLCVYGEGIASSLPRDKFINMLFARVEASQSYSGQTVCPECSTLVILNYRKHFFDSLGEASRQMDWFKSFPPSTFGMGMAATVHEKQMGKRPYVAIQYRTGRTLTRIRDMAHGHAETAGVREVVADEYRTWAFACAEVLIGTALEETRAMKREKGLDEKARTMFFLASDMFNEGWKHGEYNNDETRVIMDDLAKYFERRLDGMVTFEPEVVGLTQDVMGLAAVGDAAMCYSADRFVAHDTSSMGWYVGETRQEWRHLDSRIEECPKPEHNSSVIERIDKAVAAVQK